MKIVKWEYFFVFSDGERESMWEITRKPGKNLLSHELDMLRHHEEEKNREAYFFVLVATYANGTTKEI